MNKQDIDKIVTKRQVILLRDKFDIDYNFVPFLSLKQKRYLDRFCNWEGNKCWNKLASYSSMQIKALHKKKDKTITKLIFYDIFIKNMEVRMFSWKLIKESLTENLTIMEAIKTRHF